MEYKSLLLEDITPSLLDDFDRYEEVYRAWRKEKGEYYLKDVYYTESWDSEELKTVQNSLKETIIKGGTVLGVYDKTKLVGFASLESQFFGSKNQYIQLSNLHITRDYRSLGIGKTLFNLCVEKASEYGAKKIYISASSCENTQIFYKRMGCVFTKEINKKLHELEPYDCQLEFEIKL
ncbi:GNAT family N-acetyltransferase [Alkaliphilus pronyensis]|uniref:GNAT family N-acetyltransferase n=1 Tax=Alkaliphilus pronyensis TaxID=1482732 RepID=A0A6I0EYT8_9FIRM|nr:GNAT family N-acetyltransferase [Alkaliphilus pronyensis]KAB3531039.1 GNAT family N-acetyltransferase [Alkaliphilus pronyensis]